MATLKDISTRAGVSTFTVSKVLSGKGVSARISPARCTQIKRIARELDYRPHAGAKAMRSGRVGQIGVVLHQRADDPFRYLAGFEYVLGLNLRLEAAGFTVALLRIGDLECEAEPRVLREHLVDGLVVIDALPAVVEKRIAKLGPPTIWLDAGVWRTQGCLRRDETLAGRLAAEALLAAGCRQMVWCGPQPRAGDHYSLHERYAGAAAAVSAAGHKLRCSGYFQAHDLIDPHRWLTPGVGVIAYDTLHVRWLAQVAAELALRPGHEFALTCCDDTHEVSVTWPQLSRARIDRFALGGTAADLLLDRLADSKAKMPSQRAAVAWIAGSTARLT